MRRKRLCTLALALVPALAGVMVLLWLLGEPPAAFADPAIRYVAISGDDILNDCTNNGNPCRTVQQAVDVADAFDEIWVATGTYTDTAGTVVSIPSPKQISSCILDSFSYLSSRYK